MLGIKKGVMVGVLLMLSAGAYSADWLFRKGKSSYQIVVSADASTSEQTAARELQQYIQQVSGVELPVTSDLKVRGRSIYVGYNERVAALTGAQKPAKDDESFTYHTVGHDLLIWGGAQRGTMYGVFTFLERELGIHWLTPECTIVPKSEQWKLPRLNRTERPFIGYRYSNYFVARDVPEWSAHTRENTKWYPTTNDYGNIEAYYGAHTMEWLVPVKEFFATHPEYFCLRDGKRYDGYGQLCLSNPDVLEICTTRMKQRMREEPNYRIYSLSQNDNFRFCQCEQCAAIEQQYGGHSGLIVWFVNQVADAVKDEFPDGRPAMGEEEEKRFITLFGSLLKSINVLQAFDQFEGKELLADGQMQDYQSNYLDLRDKWRKRTLIDKEVVNDDLIFETELIRQVEINIDYILMLVKQYHEENCKNKEILTTISKAIGASMNLRSKKELIEDFIQTVNSEEDVNGAWEEYVKQKKEEELTTIIQEEKLKPAETRKFIDNAFRDGQVRTTGTDIDKILPAMSRFGGGENRSYKKMSVIKRIQAFFEKYLGV